MRNSFWLSMASPVLVVCLSSTLNATIIQGSETSVPFGNLNQNAQDAQNNYLVDCHSGACSPVSVVNAWAYLQGAYPNIYTGNKTLIGTSNATIQQSNLVNTANILGDDYMKSCDACNPNGPGGTPIEDTMIGMQNYIQDFSPGTTMLSMQDFYAWNVSANIQNRVAQPNYVQASTAPTAQFIANALGANDAVEAYLLYANGRAAHYVTISGINFDTTTGRGTASFIDPLTGRSTNVNITGFSQGNLNTNYSGGASIRAVYVEAPVSESSTFFLIGLGLAVMSICVKMATSAQEKAN
jgi:hypothetical protein